MLRSAPTGLPAAPALLLLVACGGEVRPTAEERALVEGEVIEAAETVMDRTVRQMLEWADSADDILDPVPYLRPNEESALRRHLNQAHIARARSLGLRPPDSAGTAAAVAAGRLVELDDSTEHWVVRDLEHSEALVTPDTEELLRQIATRFQAELREMGLPPYRLDITSVMRTAESQARLREENPNASAGVSSHEFGTTVDIAYSAYVPPPGGVRPVDASEAPWTEPYARYLVRITGERVAVGRSRELQAVLGRVLSEMQSEGRVLVLLERQQPVYHITVGRRLAEG